MAFKGHRPTGATSWPLILVAGAPKTGKSYTVAELTGSDLIGETYWIEFGEPTAEEYGKVPGARYILADHDGTFNDVLRRVREAIAEPTIDGKPNLIVIDSVSLIWEMLSAEMQQVANRRKKADVDAESKITSDLWNIAKERWKKLIRLLRSHKGPVVLVARLEVVAVMDASGQPTKDKTQKVQAHKSLPYDVDVVVQIPEYRRYQITGARSLVFNIPPGEKFDAPADFTLDSLLRRMGLAELGVAEPRQFVEPVPSAQDAMAEFGGAPHERPAERHRGRVNDEWNTATGQPLPPPAPSVERASHDQINEMVRLLGVKRGVFNGRCAPVVSQLVRRRIDDPQALSAAEARSIIETLTAEPDRTPPAPDAAPAAPGTPDNPVISRADHRQMQALFKTAGITERDDQHAFIQRVLRLDKPLESRNLITKDQFKVIRHALSTGEVPTAPEQPGPNANGEGISEFDALDQMILDVNDPQSLMDANDAIMAELQRGSITKSDYELLHERLDAHVERAQAGAAA